MQDDDVPAGQREAARTLSIFGHLAKPNLKTAVPALAKLLQKGCLEEGRQSAACALSQLAGKGHHQLVADAALPGLLALAQVRAQCVVSHENTQHQAPGDSSH